MLIFQHLLFICLNYASFPAFYLYALIVLLFQQFTLQFARCMVNVNQVFLFVTHVCIFSLVLNFYMFVFFIPFYVQI